jgi:hypothetical protein
LAGTGEGAVVAVAALAGAVGVVAITGTVGRLGVSGTGVETLAEPEQATRTTLIRI